MRVVDEPIVAPRPISDSNRIETLDALRGFALFGVMLFNLWYLQKVYLTAEQLHLEVWPGAADTAAMWFIEIFVQGKFLRLFAFLFGLGFALQLIRSEEKGSTFVPMYVRRLFVLMLLGLFNVSLIGESDILVLYSALGFVLLLMRNLSSRTLLIVSLVFLVTPWMVNSIRDYRNYDSITDSQLSIPTSRQTDARNERRRANRDEIVRVRVSGTLKDNVVINVRNWIGSFVTSNPINLFAYLRVELLMFLLGLYAGKRRIFENIEANLAFFRKTRWWAMWVGIVGISSYFVLERILLDSLSMPFFASRASDFLHSIGSPALSIFYGATIVLLMQNKAWRSVLGCFAIVGRMTLTNYLTHSIVLVAMLYGVGLGLYATISPINSIWLTLIMYALMIIFSSWWMRRFRFGPVEWLWRSMSYGEFQPLRLK